MNAPPAARVLVLDLAGVVCRFDPGRRLTELAAAAGRGVEEVRPGVERLIADGDQGRLSLEQGYDRLAAIVGGERSREQLRRLWSSAYEPDADVAAVVAEAGRSLATALLTNNGPLEKDMLAVRFPELAALFGRAFFAYELGAAKPEPAVFRTVARALACDPAAIVFVDDSERHVAAARDQGWDAIHFHDAAELRQELARRGLVAGRR
jgi:putative hydrolase of the HAD superfamily